MYDLLYNQCEGRAYNKSSTSLLYTQDDGQIRKDKNNIDVGGRNATILAIKIDRFDVGVYTPIKNISCSATNHL